jgi:hypothetical protein
MTEGASEDDDNEDEKGDEGEGDLYNTDNEPYSRTLSDGDDITVNSAQSAVIDLTEFALSPASTSFLFYSTSLTFIEQLRRYKSLLKLVVVDKNGLKQLYLPVRTYHVMFTTYRLSDHLKRKQGHIS